MNSSFIWRSRVIIFFVILLAGAVLTRLFWVQVIHGEFYANTANRQYVTPASGIYERGTIYFTRKDGELIRAATQISGFKIAIVPSKLKDTEATFTKLSET